MADKTVFSSLQCLVLVSMEGAGMLEVENRDSFKALCDMLNTGRVSAKKVEEEKVVAMCASAMGLASREAELCEKLRKVFSSAVCPVNDGILSNEAFVFKVALAIACEMKMESPKAA